MRFTPYVELGSPAHRRNVDSTKVAAPLATCAHCSPLTEFSTCAHNSGSTVAVLTRSTGSESTSRSKIAELINASAFSHPCVQTNCTDWSVAGLQFGE